MDVPDVPDVYMCSITRDIMKDPYIAQDGFSYERDAIKKWFLLGRKTSPITNNPLECTQIYPNRALKMNIQQYLQEKREERKSQLLDELTHVHSNAPMTLDDPLPKYALVNVTDSVVDTISILYAVLLSWKQDVEVCEMTIHAVVKIIDTDDESHIQHRWQCFDFFTIVMDAMRRFDNVPTFQSCALRYIQRYSCANGFLKAVSIQKFRACDVVVYAMKDHALDKAVQLEGAKAIEMLGLNFPSNILKSGVSKVLLSAATQYYQDAEMVVTICRAMLNLTAGTCARVCHGGFCRTLADSMNLFPCDKTLQKMCCLVLGKLCHSKTNCDASVCDMLIACMHTFSNDVDMMHACCMAVTRLAYWKQYAARLGELGGCETILLSLANALHENNEINVTSSLQAIESMTSEDENNRATLAANAKAKVLVDALAVCFEHRKIVLSSIKSLYYLCLFSASFTTTLEDEWGASFKTIRAMRRHLGEEEIQESAWMLLDILSEHKSLQSVVMDYTHRL
jgi:hypothetical protein